MSWVVHDRLRHPRYRIREPLSFFQPSLLFCLNRYSPREFSTDFCVCCPHAMSHARFCALSILNSVLRSIVRRPRTPRQSKLFWAERTFTHQRAHSAQTTRQKASTDPYGSSRRRGTLLHSPKGLLRTTPGRYQVRATKGRLRRWTNRQVRPEREPQPGTAARSRPGKPEAETVSGSPSRRTR